MRRIEAIGLDNIPMIKEGDDLVDIIRGALGEQDLTLRDGDVLIVTEKIVAKTQGRLVRLEDVTPSEEAKELAEKTDKDPQLVELILRESKEVLRAGEGHLIVETKNGLVMANAGLDRSNVGEGFVKLPPEEPDATAAAMRTRFEEGTGTRIGVIISDSAGRPFRSGSVGLALGASGVKALDGRVGEKDLFNHELKSTMIATGDLISSLGNLVTGETDEGIPVVLVRGLDVMGEGQASDLVREKEKDLFR